VDSFIAHKNIEHFRRLLGTISDPHERQAVQQLLQEEIDKLPPEQREGERRIPPAQPVRAEGGAA